MSVHDLHPGILRIVIEKADLDEQAIREQIWNRDHGPIPQIAIIGRPVGVGVKPIGTCFPSLVQPATATDKIVQQSPNAFVRESQQGGIASRPFIRPVIPLNLTKDTVTARDRWKRGFSLEPKPAKLIKASAERIREKP